MKSKSIGSLIVLAILAPSCGGGGNKSSAPPPGPVLPRWSSQYRVPTTSNLRAVRFGNPLQGIVAGEAGTFVRTDDGGASWTQLEFSPASRSGDVLALSVASTTAVAVGIDAGTGGSAAWTSRDATSWTTPDDPVSRFALPWVDVEVVAPASGPFPNETYRLRSTGELDIYVGGYSVTKDSRNIQPLPPPVPPNPLTPWTTANGMVFFGLTGYGLVCGNNGGNGEIRRTSDGDNYDVLTLTGGPFPPLRHFWMQDTLTGFVCGDGGTILMTLDGITWAQLNNKPGTLGTTTFRTITFPADLNTGWAVGDDGTNGVIWKVTFATPNWLWSQQTVPALQPKLYDVSFLDNSTGYAVGDKGSVLKTIDGGTTWSEKAQPAANPFPQINAVDFASDGLTGLAVGNGGLVLRTLDGGKTWVNFNTSAGATNFTSVCIPRSGSGNVAYICGTNAVLTQTTLKGLVSSAWTPETIVNGNYSAILFPAGDLKGVVVGSSGELRITVDSGTTWTVPTTLPPTGTNYHAICSGGARVFAAGDSGIVSSSDFSGVAGADVWANSPTIAGAPQINTLQAPLGGGHSLFAGAADGKVYRLDPLMAGPWDGAVGAIQGAANPVASIAFSNDTSGLAVVQGAANGGVFYTTNGGATWTRSVLHVKITPSNLLRAIRMLNPVLGWAVGDGGMIIQTMTGGQ